jgi:hypothetical protein
LVLDTTDQLETLVESLSHPAPIASSSDQTPPHRFVGKTGVQQSAVRGGGGGLISATAMTENGSIQLLRGFLGLQRAIKALVSAPKDVSQVCCCPSLQSPLLSMVIFVTHYKNNI